MEHVNNESFVYGTPHWYNTNIYADNPTHQWETSNTSVSNMGDFHVYAVEWTGESISWFVDDSLYFTKQISTVDNSSIALRHPFFLLFNMAVGGFWPMATATSVGPLPAHFIIDYVRVYSTNAVPSPSITRLYGALFHTRSPPIGLIIAFKSAANYFYVSNNNDSSPVTVNATHTWDDTYETFTVEVGVRPGSVAQFISGNSSYSYSHFHITRGQRQPQS